MSVKKSVVLILIVFAAGIAVGFGIDALIVNVGAKSAADSYTGTVSDEYGMTLIDEDGNEFEIDDTVQDGIVYNVCVFERRGDEISHTRDWYGPYKSVGKAVREVKRTLLWDEGFHEIYVYKKVEATGDMTFVGRTYYVYSG